MGHLCLGSLCQITGDNHSYVGKESMHYDIYVFQG